MRYQPRLEVLEARDLTAVYGVGPGQLYADLHSVPWGKLADGDAVHVHYQVQPYRDKIALNVSGVSVLGLPGPDGQRPVIQAAAAVENADAVYWTNQVAFAGIFTVAPGPATSYVERVLIAGFELRGARRTAPFTRANGDVAWYAPGAAAVAMYRARDVTIQDCWIEDNENGLFGKSEGWEAATLYRVYVAGNHIQGNGVPGSDRYHNTYLEAVGAVYEMNRYRATVQGSAGQNLKDRGAGTILRYNDIQGGIRLLDLVEPDDGEPTLTKDPAWGRTYVYGNHLTSPEWSGSNTLIHFGTDYAGSTPQPLLLFYSNTLVSINDLDAGGRWYTYLLKLNGTQTVVAANNIVHSFAPVSGHWSGDFYLATGGGTVFLGANYFPAGAQVGQGTAVGWNNQLFGTDPGLVDALAGDYRLRPDSVCVNAAAPLEDEPQGAADFLPTQQYDPRTGWWTDRRSWADLGAWDLPRAQHLDALGGEL